MRTSGAQKEDHRTDCGSKKRHPEEKRFLGRKIGISQVFSMTRIHPRCLVSEETADRRTRSSLVMFESSWVTLDRDNGDKLVLPFTRFP